MEEIVTGDGNGLLTSDSYILDRISNADSANNNNGGSNSSESGRKESAVAVAGAASLAAGSASGAAPAVKLKQQRRYDSSDNFIRLTKPLVVRERKQGHDNMI